MSCSNAFAVCPARWEPGCEVRQAVLRGFERYPTKACKAGALRQDHGELGAARALVPSSSEQGLTRRPSAAHEEDGECGKDKSRR
jgi:hypothetical protein